MPFGSPTSTKFLQGADAWMPREDARSLTRLRQFLHAAGKFAQIAAEVLEPEG
jgi:hypothetical protein